MDVFTHITYVYMRTYAYIHRSRRLVNLRMRPLSPEGAVAHSGNAPILLLLVKAPSPTHLNTDMDIEIDMDIDTDL